jgi:hypothetical protein
MLFLLNEEDRYVTYKVFTAVVVAQCKGKW